MTIPSGHILGISFDYGHVLGGLDVEELEGRLRRAPGPAVREERLTRLRANMALGFRTHDEALARGEGHPAAWRALMRVLVRAAFEADSELSEAPNGNEVSSVVEELWTAQPTRNLWRYTPLEARHLLEDLRRIEVPMVITSNSEGRARELLAELGLLPYFREVLDSGRLGFAKPDRRIFALAAEALGMPSSNIVHIGDSESADVGGAAAAGMWTIRFDGFVPAAGADPTQAHLRARNYDELRKHLAEVLSKGRALPQAEEHPSPA